MISSPALGDWGRPRVLVLSEDDESDWSSQKAIELQRALRSRNFDVSSASWTSKFWAPDDIYVVVDSAPDPMLSTASTRRFSQIKSLVTQCNRILWTRWSTETLPAQSPGSALITGLARTAHAENEKLRLITLDIQQCLDPRAGSSVGPIIAHILLRSLHPFHGDTTLNEREYVYRNGRLLIPRILVHEKYNKWISRSIGKRIFKSRAFGDFKYPVKFAPCPKAFNDQFIFTRDDALPKRLEDFDIQIDIKAHGVNFTSFAFAHTFIEASDTIVECAGIVAAVGSKITEFSVGERVVAVGGAPFASRVNVHRDNIRHLPDSMTFEVAASIPVAFITAFHCLYHLADLRENQIVLIHGATRPIAQAAILMAKRMGAVIIAIVESDTQREILLRKLGIGNANILVEPQQRITDRISSITTKQAVDVILNFEAGTLHADALNALAFGGTILQVIDPAMSLDFKIKPTLSDRDFVYRTVNPVSLFRHQPHRVNFLFSKVMSLFEGNAIMPNHSITTGSVTRIESIFKSFESQIRNGAVVVESNENALIKTLKAPHVPLTLDTSASYIIAGGLGDVGYKICELMIRRGARHIVVLSRRAYDLNEYQILENSLRMISSNVKLYWKTCDINDAKQVRACSESLKSCNVPTVKGVIQAAAVLKVGLNFRHSKFSD